MPIRVVERAGCWVLLVWLVLSATACAPRKMPVLVPARDASDRSVVVLIPGITGVKLRRRDNGKVVWGLGKHIFMPRDSGYSMALPLDTPFAGPAALEPSGPILELKLLKFYRRDVYASTVRRMEANGYELGDLDRPTAAGDFFFFNYDWRLDSVHAARQLGQALERLRRVRGDRRLRVNLICQSNAALIGRYLAKYGTVSLEQAEAGIRVPTEGIAIERLIQVGAANGGSLRILHELDRGRRYFKLLGRKLEPEVLFSLRSVFEGLPSYRRDLFLGPDGSDLDVDLFDPVVWERFGWSIFSDRVRRRVDRSNRPDLYGDETSRREHLRVWLDRAGRLHRLLQHDPPGWRSPRIYLLQDAYLPTMERAMLDVRNGEWKTFFMEDRAVRRNDYLKSRAVAPGDGHATAQSMNWMSPRERAAITGSANVSGGHFDVIRQPAAGRYLLEFLRD